MEVPKSPPVKPLPAVLDSFGSAGKQYSVEELLGEGSYGSVYRCVRSSDGEVFAVKVIDPRRIAFACDAKERSREVELMAAREAETLRKLAGHPGIVSLEAALHLEATGQIFIVTEFLAGGHLFSHLVCRAGPLPEEEASHIVAQLADALAFCHAKGVVHRDVKLENVLVSSVEVQLVEDKSSTAGLAWRTQELFTVKICDFGLAKALTAHAARTPVGTPNYSAPEVLPGTSHYNAYKADAFSFGILIFVMLCMSFPCKEGGEGCHRQHERWAGLTEKAKSLLDGLLAHDPERRLSIAQAKIHEWVSLLTLASSAPDEQEQESRRYRRPRSESKSCVLQEVAGLKVQPSMSPRTPKANMTQDAATAGILLLSRTIVEVQHERGMACWAISFSAAERPPGSGGMSCWDQLKKNVQVTSSRLAEAQSLLQGTALGKMHTGAGKASPLDALEVVEADLKQARKLAFQQEPPSSPSLASFDEIFTAYNNACSLLVEVLARSIECLRPNATERALQRFCLASVAAEQLARERGVALFTGANRFETTRRLTEILGARKVLLGTAQGDNSRMGGDIVASNAGLLGLLMGERREPPLLSVADIARLERVEEQMLENSSVSPAAEEWWEVLTSLVKQIHSRIAIGLVEVMRVEPSWEAPHMRAQPPSESALGCVKEVESCKSSDCRAGLKRLLQNLVDQL